MKLRNLILSTALLSGAAANAAELNIEFQNLTQGIYFTPILVAAHPAESSLFETGESASDELQMMAEGGDISGLANIIAGVNGNAAEVQAELTAPGMSRSFALSTDANNTVLSLTSMLLPTNDAFVGLDNWTIPTEAGTYTLYLNAYDAGTEANDEIRGSGAPGQAGMPVPPPLEALVGTGGSGVTAEETNTTVHIHRGNVGDSMNDGGISDINSSVQRWLNPIAKLTVTVQ
ncbi:spondin domain-containing protein [Planctobacterium marinum]|uniref:spondin domain-containing protein n=1 Tax=Planctobacterium marinum TaxID=1631968 RepID=UPI001E60913A|nr:spondin domain-containing protein [Planctobacterium marinum]MCC2606868.1 spondin domain-containing protein [Planctobacterium marinum]